MRDWPTHVIKLISNELSVDLIELRREDYLTVPIQLAQHISACIFECIEYIIQDSLDFLFRL